MKRVNVLPALIAVLMIGVLTVCGAIYSRGAKAVTPPKASPTLQRSDTVGASVREDRELLKSLLEMEETDSQADLELLGTPYETKESE